MNALGWWRAIVLSFGILSLAACTESANLFSTLDDQAEPTLSIVPAGSIIRPDQRLDVQIRYPSQDSSRATRMRVELQDPRGRVHGTVEFDRDELAEPLIRTFSFADSQDDGYQFWDVESEPAEDDDRSSNDDAELEDTEPGDTERMDDVPELSPADGGAEDEDAPVQDDLATGNDVSGDDGGAIDDAPVENEGPMAGEAVIEDESPTHQDVAIREDDSLHDGTERRDENEDVWEEESRDQELGQPSDDAPPIDDDDPPDVEEEPALTENETGFGDGNRRSRTRRDPNLPRDGVYTLVTEAWINNQLLLTDRRQIFMVSDPPRIESITIHPSTIRREMQALAIAEIDYAEATRPYLRWRFDGTVAAEGYLEDGYDRVILDGGGKTVGAYQVMLEVYPWGVDEGVQIDGNTRITAKSDVVVRAELLPDPPDFLQQFEGAPARYFSFDGTREAWTDDSSHTVEATITENVYLDMVSGALGVRLDHDGEVLSPLPVPDGSDSVHIVALRISSSGAATTSHDEPVISFGSSNRNAVGVPIFTDEGVLVVNPSGAAPIPMGRMPDRYELKTFRFLMHDRSGSTLIEPLLDDGPSGRLIDLGTGLDGVALRVRGGSGFEIFVDRIVVSSHTKNEVRAHFVDRATIRLLESLKKGDRQWAVSIPSDWSEYQNPPGDYPAPSDSISINIDDSPTVNALLPDRAGLHLIARDSEGSERRLTLRRRGDMLELSDEQTEDPYIARTRFPGRPYQLSSLQIQVLRSITTETSQGTVVLRYRQNEQGTLITLNLPESVAPGELSVFPEAFEAHLPAWVGRWIR